jgi:hypothetical protein
MKFKDLKKTNFVGVKVKRSKKVRGALRASKK